MNDITQAIGELAQGGMLARAVEPSAGGVGPDGHTHESACLNCGTALIGSHCHACGQRGHVHRTLGAFFHDLVHGVFHFEGKIWHTLPMLAWRPGELTRRYIAGERARFVSPMALFLFAVFLMFAVFQLVGLSAPTDFGNVNVPEMGTGAQLQKQLDGLREARSELADDNPAVPIIDRQIEGIERRISEEATEARGEPEGLAQSEDGGSTLTPRRTGWAFFDHAIAKWRENPGLMAYKLQANSYKFSWLLIPLSVPFVWLMFAWRRRFGAYDHAVFVTYSLCFMSLLFVTVAALGQVPGVPGAGLFFATVLIPPLHIYKQLRGAYGLSRFSALWRTMTLLMFIFIILFLFIDLLLLLGALG
ncbi:MAG TPA: DUF3667 domain-containing protein [Croceibacterium sp.]